MSIKFNCPHCQKPLKVKDELAGKKARCPGCQQALTIPNPAPAPVDIEAAAAAALADEPKAPEPVQEQGPVEFRCAFCDEQVQVSAALAGKQAPCPSCRRIIKIPLPVKQAPKDWRQADNRLPSGARRESEPELAGAWGSATSSSRVSADALLEADAVPVVRERVTVRQWIIRGLVATAAIVLLGTGIWGMFAIRRQNLQAKALNAALAYADKQETPLPAGVAAELHRALGEYYLRADNLKDAGRQFPQARGLAKSLRADSPEGDALLIDLAATQVEMGGDDQAVVNGTRVGWDTVHSDVKKTLSSLSSPEARVEALRIVAGKLLAKGQQGIANPLPYDLESVEEERPQLLAVIGLEAYRAGGDAKLLAGEALRQYQTTAPAGKNDKKSKAKRPPAPPQLIALLLALHQSENVERYFAAAPKAGEHIPLELRLGYAQGWALRGKLDKAHELANDTAAAPLDRLETLVAIGSVEEDGHKDDARKDVEAAMVLMGAQVKAREVSPWLLFRLVRLGAQVGVKEEQLAALARIIRDRGFRGRAQMEIVRAHLGDQPDLERLGEPDKLSPLTLELLARHNSRLGKGSAVMDMIQGWQPEALRPLGYAGVTLGVQDIGK